MKINYHRQTQFELFPGTPQQTVKRSKTPFLKTRLSLSLENIGILGILMVVSMVASFSIGVERGKRTARPAPERGIRTAALRSPVPKTLPAEPAREQASPQVSPPAEEKRDWRSEKPEMEIARMSVPLPGAAETQAGREENPADEKAGMYTVQVASFRKDKFAQQEAKTLKKKGYEIFVIPKGKYSIVCVGRFSQRRQAQDFSAELRKKYKDCIIRSL